MSHTIVTASFLEMSLWNGCCHGNWHYSTCSSIAVFMVNGLLSERILRSYRHENLAFLNKIAGLRITTWWKKNALNKQQWYFVYCLFPDSPAYYARHGPWLSPRWLRNTLLFCSCNEINNCTTRLNLPRTVTNHQLNYYLCPLSTVASPSLAEWQIAALEGIQHRAAALFKMTSRPV